MREANDPPSSELATCSATQSALVGSGTRNPRYKVDWGAPDRSIRANCRAGFVPGVLDTAIYDEVIQASNEEAFDFARQLARREGIPVGISSGAAVSAAVKLGQRPAFAGKTIVIIIPSFAERYLSTALFEGLD